MNSFLRLYISLILIFLVASCGPNKDNEQERFNQQLDEFSEKMKEIDDSMDLVDRLNKRVSDIEERYEGGEITREEADLLIEEVNRKYSREIARSSNLNPAQKLPKWARDLGLTEPEGLTLDRDYSRQTSVDNQEEGYNSVTLIYNGPYEKSMEQASLIADKAGIPITKEYKMVQELKEQYGEDFDDIKGIAFMNYDLNSMDIVYKISISVDEYGTFTLNAVNVQQMNERLGKYRNTDLY